MASVSLGKKMNSAFSAKKGANVASSDENIKNMMNLVIAIGLDAATLVCLGIQTLGLPGVYIGETLSYVPKIFSVVLLGNWNFKSKKGILKNKKILFKLIPWAGDLPLNTFYVLSNTKKR